MLIGAPALLAVVAGLTWFSTGRALGPVDAIRREFARLSARDLRGRMPVPAGDDAPARLAVTLNDTLDRLDESVRKQRQFVADASHELRSPLAALRTPLEVAQEHPDRVDWPGIVSGTLEDLDRLDRLVADLLTLARIDAETREGGEPTELAELITEVADRRTPANVERSLHLADSVVVRGHRTHLARLLTNLFDNAERYARQRVEVRLSVTRGRAQVEVADDGPGVPDESRERIFERFTRIDTSRQRSQGGAGLGLALARDIAALHGGTLELAEFSGGARFVVTLPLEPPPDEGNCGDRNQ
ncbi:sensor histidine kinase [Prauserella halophila]|nr:HAMP domain-containing sensor histidine kinase [Prauserella halophila]